MLKKFKTYKNKYNIYKNDKGKFQSMAKNLSNVVIQMNVIYIHSQVNLLNLF
jgi:hypothetical protein